MKAAHLADRFADLFAFRPRIFRAPGRVNLIGEHTDYNDGYVLPATIGFSAYVALGPRSDRKLVLHSAEFSGHFEFDLDHLPSRRLNEWCDYVVGVALALAQQGVNLSGANLLLHGEVPIGAGLSSSASVEVASALALLNWSGMELPIPEIARLCQQAENNFVGARVGIMDQFVSCAGKRGNAILLDCRSLSYELAPVPPDVQLVVCNTMVKHDLATGTYNIRRAECEEGVRYFAQRNPSVRALRDVSLELLEQHASDLPPAILKRCSHVIHENQRTLDAANAFRRGDIKRMGALMCESHRSLRDLYEVSCRELDVMVESAHGLPGFIGGRMTGGGFGGCTVNLVRKEHARDFSDQIAGRFREKTGIDPQVYICCAEDGAQELPGPF
ncbi:MAG TPA: galactokinase [Candidatus Sulfotelmatobacter sp.]|nr:galactokinase [Candidatus Sulfotelmatobacter sp.]